MEICSIYGLMVMAVVIANTKQQLEMAAQFVYIPKEAVLFLEQLVGMFGTKCNCITPITPHFATGLFWMQTAAFT
jgi:hypothetical protein